jgi:tRNA1Val (adenine37-N6)-methyltransferase
MQEHESGPELKTISEFTMDHFLNGKIKVKQGRKGYRFSVDAVILAGFMEPRNGMRAADLGTGCGIIPLLMAHGHKNMELYGIEIQKDLAEIALENVRNNGLDQQITILQEDIKTLNENRLGGPLDLVVSNPPYRRVRGGKLNPHHQKAGARHEIHGTLEDFISASRRLLKESGRLSMIYLAERAVDLMCGMRDSGVEPKKIRWVHSHFGSPAKLVLVEGMKGGGTGVEILKPLYLYNQDGSYNPEVQGMMTG